MVAEKVEETETAEEVGMTHEFESIAEDVKGRVVDVDDDGEEADDRFWLQASGSGGERDAETETEAEAEAVVDPCREMAAAGLAMRGATTASSDDGEALEDSINVGAITAVAIIQLYLIFNFFGGFPFTYETKSFVLLLIGRPLEERKC